MDTFEVILVLKVIIELTLLYCIGLVRLLPYRIDPIILYRSSEIAPL
jgi:hypothetical protein